MNDDTSKILESLNTIMSEKGISNDTVSNLFNTINNSKEPDSSEEGTPSNIDFETILKITSAFEKLNSNDDSRITLLKALRPYLKKSKQGKIEQYIQLLNVSKMLEIFPSFMGCDKKNE